MPVAGEEVVPHVHLLLRERRDLLRVELGGVGALDADPLDLGRLEDVVQLLPLQLRPARLHHREALLLVVTDQCVGEGEGLGERTEREKSDERKNILALSYRWR